MNEPLDSDDDDAEDSSDEEMELDMETFDTKTLVKDDADRKLLDAMTELEREAELATRFEKLKAEQDMKKAMREAKYVLNVSIFFAFVSLSHGYALLPFFPAGERRKKKQGQLNQLVHRRERLPSRNQRPSLRRRKRPKQQSQHQHRQ